MNRVILLLFDWLCLNLSSRDAEVLERERCRRWRKVGGENVESRMGSRSRNERGVNWKSREEDRGMNVRQ